MATRTGNTKSNIDLSKNEISRIEKALKDKEFVKLLGEYASELNDPENKKRYETEITQLEADRGNSVQFLNPKPGYVMKTKDVATGRKVFVNICSDEKIGAPVSEASREAGTAGLAWSIPYSQSQPREDVDRGGERCGVYDVIFHPDTLYLAGRDPRMRNLVQTTALDALERAFNTQCERTGLKFPRMKFKGKFRPTVIRAPVEGSKAAPSPAAPTAAELLPELPTRPTFSLRYRSTPGLQDCVLPRGDPAPPAASRPDQIVVDIELPLLDSAAGVELDVQERSLSLERADPPRYRLELELPYPVQEERGAAKFDQARKTLEVVLPVRPAPQQIAERLCSSDSGIEVDTSDRTQSSDVDSEEAAAGECSQPASEPRPAPAEQFRTTDSDLDQAVDDFLNSSLSYSLPGFSCSVQGDVIIFTLEVKNVSPESFEKRVEAEGQALRVKFSNMGAGFVPLHHAFAVDFLIGGTVDEGEVEVEFWDNNLLLQLPLQAAMQEYRVGLAPTSLSEQVLTIERGAASAEEPAGLKSSKKKRNKYKHEKHPKVMKLKEEESEEREEGEKRRKERHGSGDSLDSFMSESPMETIQLVEDEEEEMKTEDSCDEEVRLVPPPRYSRAVSEDSSDQRPRSILKRKTFEMVGNRFRCYSESNMEDLGWSSNDKLSFALSEAKITEDEELSLSAGSRKSVSFNEKVQQQFYR